MNAAAAAGDTASRRRSLVPVTWRPPLRAPAARPLSAINLLPGKLRRNWPSDDSASTD